MTHDEMIAVIQAAKEGKEIEYKNLGNCPWGRIENNPGRFDFIRFEYRVKPEPVKLKEIWVTEYPPARMHLYGDYFGWATREIALANAGSAATRPAVLYREVPTCKCGSELPTVWGVAQATLCSTCEADRQGLK